MIPNAGPAERTKSYSTERSEIARASETATAVSTTLQVTKMTPPISASTERRFESAESSSRPFQPIR